MIVQVNVGGVVVSFGEPQAPNKPEPFYPYLLTIDPIQDSVGEETGSTGFSLLLKAQSMIDLNLRRQVIIRNDDLEVQFEGVIGGLTYDSAINVRVEA